MTDYFRKPLVLIFAAGLFLRLVLAAVTFHPDIVHFDLAGYVLSQGNILNFYDYTFSLDKEDPFLKAHPVELFNYPPSVYFSVGLINSILTNLQNREFHNEFLFHFQETFGNPNLFLHLLLLKLPYLAFDLGVGLLLYNFFEDKRSKLLAFCLWMFNPLAIYSTFMMGQFDVIPTFFTVLALYLAKHGTNDQSKIYQAALFLGIGAAFKVFPILFLIPLALLFKNWPKRLLVVFIGLLPYVVTTLPFIGSFGFRSTALVANQTLKSLYAQIPISGGEGIILFILTVVFLYIVFLYSSSTLENLWQKGFMLILLFFIFTHYHPQWFLWLTPFLIIELIKTNFKHVFVILIMFVSFLGGVLLYEPSLSVGLFSPLVPSFFISPDIWKLMGANIDYSFIKSIFQTVFVGCSLYFLYYYFPEKEA